MNKLSEEYGLSEDMVSFLEDASKHHLSYNIYLQSGEDLYDLIVGSYGWSVQLMNAASSPDQRNAVRTKARKLLSHFFKLYKPALSEKATKIKLSDFGWEIRDDNGLLTAILDKRIWMTGHYGRDDWECGFESEPHKAYHHNVSFHVALRWANMNYRKGVE
jgi:hypothetical protein